MVVIIVFPRLPFENSGISPQKGAPRRTLAELRAQLNTAPRSRIDGGRFNGQLRLIAWVLAWYSLWGVDFTFFLVKIFSGQKKGSCLQCASPKPALLVNFS